MRKLGTGVRVGREAQVIGNRSRWAGGYGGRQEVQGQLVGRWSMSVDRGHVNRAQTGIISAGEWTSELWDESWQFCAAQCTVVFHLDVMYRGWRHAVPFKLSDHSLKSQFPQSPCAKSEAYAVCFSVQGCVNTMASALQDIHCPTAISRIGPFCTIVISQVLYHTLVLYMLRQFLRKMVIL